MLPDKEARPYGDPNTSSLWLIGHDPRLRESDAEASTCFFLDLLDVKPRTAADRAKRGLAEAVIAYVRALAGDDFHPSSLYVTNLCNGFLPPAKSGTVLIPDDVAENGARAIADALARRTAPPPVILATSQQVLYHLTRLGHVEIEGGDAFVDGARPAKAAMARGTYVPAKPRAFLAMCGTVGFWNGSPVVPVLHVKQWQSLRTAARSYVEPMDRAAQAVKAALRYRAAVVQASRPGKVVALALAWQLAVQLARRHTSDDVRVTRVHDGVILVSPRAPLAKRPFWLRFGNGGTCYTSPGNPGRDFSATLRFGRPFSDELDALERAAGLPHRSGSAPTTPRLLVLRAIAEMIARTALTKAPLDASSGVVEGHGEVGPNAWVSDVPEWATALRALPADATEDATYFWLADRWLIHEPGEEHGYHLSLSELDGRRALLDAERGELVSGPQFSRIPLMPIYERRHRLDDVVRVVEDALG